jgi:hypothetical protein
MACTYLGLRLSLGYEPITHQASPLRVNTDIIKVCASCVDLDVTKEVEDEDINVFAKGDYDNGAGTRSTKSCYFSQ